MIIKKIEKWKRNYAFKINFPKLFNDLQINSDALHFPSERFSCNWFQRTHVWAIRCHRKCNSAASGPFGSEVRNKQQQQQKNDMWSQTNKPKFRWNEHKTFWIRYASNKTKLNNSKSVFFFKLNQRNRNLIKIHIHIHSKTKFKSKDKKKMKKILISIWKVLPFQIVLKIKLIKKKK